MDSSNSFFERIGDSRIYKQVSAYLFAALLLLQIPPYFMWEDKRIVIIFSLMCSVICVLNLRELTRRQLGIFMLLEAFYFFVSVRSYLNIQGMIVTMMLPVMILCSKDFIKSVFDKFSLLFSLTLVPSIICFVLVVFVGVSLPSTHIEALNSIKEYNYFQYPFFVIEDYYNGSYLPRFMGYYDEPGVIGTFTALILVCRRFDMSDKLNIPIFVAGLLSFSFAFYLVAFLYVVCFAILRYKLCSMVIVVFSMILFSDSDSINSYVFDRFRVEDGQVAGDNRVVGGGEEFMKSYRWSDQYWFGYGDKMSEKVNRGGASYIDLLIDYGLIGFLYFVGVFVYESYKRFRLNKEHFMYLLLLLLIIYQRPFIRSYVYVFLIIAPLIYLDDEYREPESASDPDPECV